MNVAISGHQNLGTPETVLWVEKALMQSLAEIDVTKGYTCLAIGADQLFARFLIKRGIPYIAVLACSEIESSFEIPENISTFRSLLASANGVIELPHTSPSEQAYFDAGKTVVDESDILIAIWNGQPARGLGGTGDVVEYALKNGKRIIHINLVSKTVSELSPH